MVNEQTFFAMCERLEAAGLRSGWPHPARLYRQLCGKLWVPQMSLNPAFRVPPTTAVQRADVLTDPQRAARQAIEVLCAIQRQVWQKEPEDGDFKGVAKLGFSWQGKEVIPFCGAENLARVLVRLLDQKGESQMQCLVQARVPVTCEHRVLCFHEAATGGFVRERLWLTMMEYDRVHKHHKANEVPGFELTSAYVVPPPQVPDKLFKGDREAPAAIEAQVDELVNQWLLWFRASCTDPPPVTRLDFLVSPCETGYEAWTCEVGECGASLCSVECDARNAAVLNWAVRHDPSGRFPLPLPRVKRNNGWKS